uniref:EF-hand domain-containing protein n=1 Tax=Chromera velia CCMP2878 TaxID=1169474 RepID=A0A0G4H0U6_9ALVE|eukprot:Cvel_24247.t1-p1 / transcript=Cvel_24247.t1 / gene=Cvel_24247 / organism=Chromera_velia_CCMP2878 / gene_product=Nuclear distribution protein PAC1-1, putative / transcript_product=Nuclear distribution protein PAC1-1, putative / location=Cvel_scaffold2597:458-15111(+) / protein_length=1642 / sequence_SO=supercontig / SO=protein_coding / is_pseudo=false
MRTQAQPSSAEKAGPSDSKTWDLLLNRFSQYPFIADAEIDEQGNHLLFPSGKEDDRSKENGLLTAFLPSNEEEGGPTPEQTDAHGAPLQGAEDPSSSSTKKSDNAELATKLLSFLRPHEWQQQIRAIKREFTERGGEVELTDFVYILKKHISRISEAQEANSEEARRREAEGLEEHRPPLDVLFSHVGGRYGEPELRRDLSPSQASNHTGIGDGEGESQSGNRESHLLQGGGSSAIRQSSSTGEGGGVDGRSCVALRRGSASKVPKQGGSGGIEEEVLLVTRLINLFELVDINGDQRISWDEFMSFVVDRQLSQEVQRQFTQVRLMRSESVDDGSHSSAVEEVLYIAGGWLVGVMRLVTPELRPLKDIVGPRSPICSVCYSARAALLIVACTDLTICIFRINHQQSRIRKSQMLRDGSMFFSGDREGTVICWDLKEIGLQAQRGPGQQAQQSIGGGQVQGGQSEGGKSLDDYFETHYMKYVIWEEKAHSECVTGIEEMALLHSIATCSLDGTVCILDTQPLSAANAASTREREREKEKESREREREGNHMQGSPGEVGAPGGGRGRHAGGDAGGLGGTSNPSRRTGRRPLQERRRLVGHSRGIKTIFYNPVNKILLTGGFDYLLLVWNPYVETAIQEIKGHTAPIVGIDFLGKSTGQFVTADTSGAVKTWDVSSFICLQTLFLEELHSVRSMCLILPGRRLLVAGRKMVAFDFRQTGERHKTDEQPVQRALYSSKMKSFVTAAGQVIKVWDANSGKVSHTWRRTANSHSGDVLCCAFSFRLGLVATGAADRVVSLFMVMVTCLLAQGSGTVPSPAMSAQTLENAQSVSAVTFLFEDEKEEARLRAVRERIFQQILCKNKRNSLSVPSLTEGIETFDSNRRRSSAAPSKEAITNGDTGREGGSVSGIPLSTGETRKGSNAAPRPSLVSSIGGRNSQRAASVVSALMKDDTATQRRASADADAPPDVPNEEAVAKERSKSHRGSIQSVVISEEASPVSAGSIGESPKELQEAEVEVDEVDEGDVGTDQPGPSADAGGLLVLPPHPIGGENSALPIPPSVDGEGGTENLQQTDDTDRVSSADGPADMSPSSRNYKISSFPGFQSIRILFPPGLLGREAKTQVPAFGPRPSRPAVDAAASSSISQKGSGTGSGLLSGTDQTEKGEESQLSAIPTLDLSALKLGEPGGSHTTRTDFPIPSTFRTDRPAAETLPKNFLFGPATDRTGSELSRLSKRFASVSVASVARNSGPSFGFNVTTTRPSNSSATLVRTGQAIASMSLSPASAVSQPQGSPPTNALTPVRFSNLPDAVPQALVGGGGAARGGEGGGVGGSTLRKLPPHGGSAQTVRSLTQFAISPSFNQARAQSIRSATQPLSPSSGGHNPMGGGGLMTDLNSFSSAGQSAYRNASVTGTGDGNGMGGMNLNGGPLPGGGGGGGHSRTSISVTAVAERQQPSEASLPPHLKAVLFCTDEDGMVAAWDLRRILWVEACAPVPAREVQNPHKITNDDQKGQAELKKRQALATSGEPVPVVRHALVRKLCVWRAHEDAIRSIQIVDEPRCLLTGGYDCMARVWTLDGHLLAELKQSNPNWNFEAASEFSGVDPHLLKEVYYEVTDREREDARVNAPLFLPEDLAPDFADSNSNGEQQD